jgi:hypothetical protein
MHKVTLRYVLDPPWLHMNPAVVLGKIPPGRGTPELYVTVERDGHPIARIDAFAPDPGPFVDAVACGDLVAVGIASNVYVIDPESREIRAISCDGYFGHFYDHEGALLIATSSELICLDQRGAVKWTTRNLGLDGVIVDGIEEDTISGRGECDPPGGWRPFRLSLATGLPLQEG